MSNMRRGTGRDRRASANAFAIPQLFQGANAAWYRADMGITGSPNITAVADQSGNGLDLSVNINSPTLVTDGGLPAIRMDGTTAQEVRRVAPASSAFAYTLAIVAKIDTSAVATNRLFGVHRARGCAIGSTGATMLCTHAGAAHILGGAQDTANYKVYLAYGGNASPFTPKLYINTTLQTNSPSGNQTYLNSTSVGDFISIGYDAVSCKGYIREALWIDRQISDAEAQKLIALLKARWSVT